MKCAREVGDSSKDKTKNLFVSRTFCQYPPHRNSTELGYCTVWHTAAIAMALLAEERRNDDVAFSIYTVQSRAEPWRSRFYK